MPNYTTIVSQCLAHPILTRELTLVTVSAGHGGWATGLITVPGDVVLGAAGVLADGCS